MCECNCKCAVTGEIRRWVQVDNVGPMYAIRDHTGKWVVISVGKGNGYTSHDHGLDNLIDSWPVVYRPA